MNESSAVGTQMTMSANARSASSCPSPARRCSHSTSASVERPPSGAATLFYRDIVGDLVRPQWRTQVRDAFTRAEISPRLVCRVSTPTTRGGCSADPRSRTIGTARTRVGVSSNQSSRQQITFNDCADDLFGMVASADFPDLAAPTSPRRGAPRASDGLIRMDGP
jgi:hypothetical protein